jgi:hypothetical protein
MFAFVSPVAVAGVAFALTLSDGGRSISGERFTLKVPGAKGPLVLVLEGPDFVGGSFVAPVRLKNDSDADLHAVTLGLEAATETLRGEKDMPGASRSIPAAAVSPPAWDVIPNGTEAPAQLFRVAPVGFGAETLLVVLLGTVHGIASAGSFELEDAKRPTGVDVDPGGSLYVTDISGRVVRCGLDGKGAVEVKGRPAPKPEAHQGGPCARSRSLGLACRETPFGGAWAIEGRDVTELGTDGRRLRAFRPGGEGPPVALALAADGRLYVATAGEEGRSGSVRVFRPF